MVFAPGGLRSELGFWRHSPSNPSVPAPWMDPMAVLSDKYRVVAMDQRNAGRSRSRIDGSDDWHIYAADHLALADHLGLDRFHVMGGCIGASFCLTLCFVFSVTREFVRQCETPLLVMPGDDPPHPKVIGEEVAELAPNVEVLRQWKGPEHLQAEIDSVTQFLERHTPR